MVYLYLTDNQEAQRMRKWNLTRDLFRASWHENTQESAH